MGQGGSGGPRSARGSRRAGRKRRQGRYTSSRCQPHESAASEWRSAARRARRRSRRPPSMTTSAARRDRRERRQADRSAAARARRGRRGRRGLRRPPGQTLDDAEQGLDDANASDLEIDVELAVDDGGTGEDEPSGRRRRRRGAPRGSRRPTRARLSEEAVEQSTPSRTILTITAGRTATTAARKGRERTRRTTSDEGELPALDADQEGAYEGE